MLSEKQLSLIQKYDRQGPRYTSYPTVPQWRQKITRADYQKALVSLSDASKTIALYTHIAFSEEKCYYCACNVVITRHKEEAEKYLGYLKKELQLIAPHAPKGLLVTQIHWGGGTPTYLNCAQMASLFGEYQKYFNIDPSAEISIEIDPRVTSREQLETLYQLGFNRVSMGVQDFEPEVQKAIHRDQTEHETRKIHDWCKTIGFKSVNMDFVYGLPYQNQQGFENTLKTIISLNPDRIAFYNYAHVPWMVPWQKRISEEALPKPEQKFQFLKSALRMFEAAGYLPVGMDHFARPQDELIAALQGRTLRRNFMGYTTQKDAALLSFGVSAISDLRSLYVQNFKKLSEYYRALDDNQWPLSRGLVLSQNDLLRRHVIMELLCNLELSIPETEKKFKIHFFDYFKWELSQLEAMVSDGLLEISSEGIQGTPLGRLLSRNIAMIFDDYYQSESGDPSPKRYSRTV